MDCATWSARFLLNNHIGLTPRLATIRYSFTGRKLALPLRARQARDSRKSIAVTFLQDDGDMPAAPSNWMPRPPSLCRFRTIQVFLKDSWWVPWEHRCRPDLRVLCCHCSKRPQLWPHISHIWEDCHDMSSVVVACRIPHESSERRISQRGSRLGRESCRLHSAEDGAAGRLSGDRDCAYRDVRCGELDRARLSPLLRPASGNAGNVERGRGRSGRGHRADKASSGSCFRYPGRLEKLSGGDPRRRREVGRHQAGRGGCGQDSRGACQRRIVGRRCISPVTTAGVYIPTALTVAPQWPDLMPFAMTSPSQFRPKPPIALESEQWGKDYNEIKELGAKNSSKRTARQTEDVRFWLLTGPLSTHPLHRQIALRKEMSVIDSARFMTVVTAAEADAMIAVLDAKYKYAFWRPITAIRNGDIDANAATERDATWLPIDNTPMHPEYPCAHCIVSSAVA